MPISKFLWMLAQIVAIGGLTYIDARGPDAPVALFVFGNIIIIAFLTAVIVNIWDWIRRLLKPARIDPEILEPLRDSRRVLPRSDSRTRLR